MDDCFIIMPIADCDDYPKGHFKHVYDDLIRPACKEAGYNPIRADDVVETNLIHLDILKKLIDSPMAICDLSTRNPNVLFELGIRQAFDKPVVLIQEKGTPKIFDIAPLRYVEYRKERVYHEVIEDQAKITGSLKATRTASGDGSGVNSIVKLLSLTSATIREVSPDEANPMLQYIRAEISELRHEFRRAVTHVRHERDSDVDEAALMIEHCGNILSRAEELVAEGEAHGVLEARELLSHASDFATKAMHIAPRRASTHMRARELEMRIMHLKDHLERGIEKRARSK
jgi:hypothetical protein